MDKLNCVLVSDFAFVEGGASKVALGSAMALARAGFRVFLLAGSGPAADGLVESGVQVVCLGQDSTLSDPHRLRAACRGLWNVAAAKAMRELLAELPPERTIVHVHTWTKVLSASVIHEAVRRNYSVVCTLHDYFTASPNGGFYNYRANEISKIKPLSAHGLLTNMDKRSYSQQWWRVARLVIQRSWGGMPGKVRHFIMLSRLSQAVLERYLPRDAIYYSLRNPIDVSKVGRVRAADNGDFVMVGRLAPEKGPDLFAVASRETYSLATFVGDGGLRQRIAELNPCARITGWLDTAGVRHELCNARALVFPSRWYEAQPLSVLEAAALGVPAVVADCCAARELIDDGATGLLFKGGDAHSLAEKLEKLRDEQLVDKLGKQAYDKYWSDPPTMEAHIKGLVAIYEKVLQARSGNAVVE